MMSVSKHIYTLRSPTQCGTPNNLTIKESKQITKKTHSQIQTSSTRRNSALQKILKGT
jgi:hypothetical protein